MTMERQNESVYTSRLETYNVTIAVWEGRQLAGFEIDPYVTLQIGQFTRKTKKKKATNDPSFHETFLFDFEMPPAVFFSQMITIDAWSSGKFLRGTKLIGRFKIDVATVSDQLNHMFFHRWAVLVDPLQPLSGPKGYLCVDIMIGKKGDVGKMPYMDISDEDIEANLLLPDDVADSISERRPARYTIGVYSAMDLPNKIAGAVSSVKRVVTGKVVTDPIDSYVQVSFAGQHGKTRVRKSSSTPVWNEQIVFVEMFPPLVRTIRVHVHDEADNLIATTFLDLSYLSDHSISGFMPTFGPAYINLYGTIRGVPGADPLNFGLGEGVAYRGRILLSLRVELEEHIPRKGVKNVHVKSCLPLPDKICGRKEQFFLFCAILSADTINKSLAGKPISFELSIGNDGSVTDGGTKPITSASGTSTADSDDLESINETVMTDGSCWHSRTQAVNAVKPEDSEHCHMPYGSMKPCLSIYTFWEDQRVRLHQVNVLKRATSSYERMIADVGRLIEMHCAELAAQRLKHTVERLATDCNDYLAYMINISEDPPVTETPLDREKRKQRQREIRSILSTVGRIRAGLQASTVSEKLAMAQKHLDRLRLIAVEVQETLPDIFLWMISGNKRVAYRRFRAEDLLDSPMNDERNDKGQYCAQRHRFFLKTPSGKRAAAEDFELWGSVNAYFWLGLKKEMKKYLSGLPMGYSLPTQIRHLKVDDPDYIPPTHITYKDTPVFELRCHIYQGRSLMPADDSGLSDPFVRVLFAGHMMQTAVKQQTLNPLWDECLVLPAVKLYGDPESVKLRSKVPEMTKDLQGPPEFLGQFECQATVKLARDRYTKPYFPPMLSWLPIYNQNHRVGEILSAFELIHIHQDMRDYPVLPTATESGRLPVPDCIRPTLVPYRIEALFWGLRSLRIQELTDIQKPCIEIEIADQILRSESIVNLQKNLNFPDQVKCMDVMLPENPIYRPPLTIRCVEALNFGRSQLIGTHVISSLDEFVVKEDPTALEQTSIIIESDEETVLSRPTTQGTVVDRRPTERIEQANEIKSSIDTDSQYLDLAEQMKSVLAWEQEAEKAEMQLIQDKGIDIDEDELPSLPFPPPEGYFEDDERASERFEEEDESSKEHDSQQERVETNAEKHMTKFENAKSSAIIHSQALRGTRERRPNTSNMALVQREEEQARQGGDTSDDSTDDEVSETEDMSLGSRRPLAPAKKQDDSKGGVRMKKSEPAVKFDWWSKYYASVADKNDAQQLDRQKYKRKKRIGTGKLVKNYIRNAVGTVHDRVSAAREKLKKGKLGSSDAIPSKTSGVTTDADVNLIERLVVYGNELESCPEFGRFSDLLSSFDLFSGKQTFSIHDKLNRYVGVFKGNIRARKIAQSQFGSTKARPIFFRELPDPTPVPVLVRVYAVMARNLKPMDSNGRADPYFVAKLGKQKQGDKSKRINHALNCNFGACYEFETTFPPDNELLLQVYDYDRMSHDELMGETCIDLEQRFFSKHRATCGLPFKFETRGYNQWRDVRRPSEILESLAKTHRLRGPYYKPGRVLVGDKVFEPPLQSPTAEKPDSENVALYALHHWHEMPKVGYHLVPEHIETRSLYLPDQIGVEQGTLDIWIDMFHLSGRRPPPPVDIAPRTPKTYELRTIIWNTKGILMDDYNPVTGSSVDQFIKCHMIGPLLDGQQTDVHYRSMRGDGNFNWRFVHRFDYMEAEEKIVYKSKYSWYSMVEHETKIAPKITVEVWDADTFSGDDYIGSLTLDMLRLVRGAKIPSMCKLSMLDINNSEKPTCSLFKQKRIRGWYPFQQINKSGEMVLAGKVDIEMQLLTLEEAEQRQAGKGHDPPEPLPEPQRPETSFNAMLSPLRFLHFTMWDGLKYKCLSVLIFILVFLFFAMFVYQLPQSVADKMVHG